MAENEHNPYECEARGLKVEHFCAAAHAVVGMSRFANEDSERPFGLEGLVRIMAGFAGAEMAENAWDLVRDVANEETGCNHGKPGTEARHRVIGRLMEYLGIAASAPADTFHHLSVVSGGSW